MVGTEYKREFMEALLRGGDFYAVIKKRKFRWFQTGINRRNSRNSEGKGSEVQSSLVWPDDLVFGE